MLSKLDRAEHLRVHFSDACLVQLADELDAQDVVIRDRDPMRLLVPGNKANPVI